MDNKATLTIFINGQQLPDAYSIEVYNIFCWNSSPTEKPTELHWYAHAGGWRPEPLMLKAKA